MKSLLSATLLATLLAPPVLAEQGAVEAAQSENPQATLEQRIRTYREQYDSRQEERRKLREEARKRHEARQQASAEKFDVWLERQEQRQEQLVKRREEMRNKAKADRDYLSEHHQELLEAALKRKDDMIKRLEEVRQRAADQKAMLAAHRAAMKGMPPEERRAYINEHREEIFGRDKDSRRPSGPRPPWMAGPHGQGMHAGQPPPEN